MQFNKMGKTCCCTLEQGTAIIGTLCIIESIFTVIANSFWISSTISNAEQIKLTEQYYNLYIVLASIGIVSGVVSFILGCLLVYGSTIRNHRYILPWLWCSYVSLVLLAAAGGMELFNVIVYGGVLGVGNFFLTVIIIIIQTYFISVVSRFVTELKAEPDN
ncbi:uncharacterized protein LOC118433006 [Folsomia candida]|uniref:uncharacterized protein LOC118433006 n=1 Tax=Folsomia candida TaxID=158441 RepID=UPI0016050765|nr:uncharacterized protein LOC118433006 [Folsomia candida]